MPHARQGPVAVFQGLKDSSWISASFALTGLGTWWVEYSTLNS